MTELQKTAIHEAGHAVVACYLGVDVDSIEIAGDGSKGSVLLNPRSPVVSDLLEPIVLALAGNCALSFIVGSLSKMGKKGLSLPDYGRDEELVEKAIFDGIAKHVPPVDAEMIFEGVLNCALKDASEELDRIFAEPGVIVCILGLANVLMKKKRRRPTEPIKLPGTIVGKIVRAYLEADWN